MGRLDSLVAKIDAELQPVKGRGYVVFHFYEPQFEPKLVTTITENTNAGTGVLDPLGASIKDGPDLYFTLIRTMARALKECLSRTG